MINIMDLFMELIDAVGGVDELIRMREELAECVCQLDDIIELEARVKMGAKITEAENVRKMEILADKLENLIQE